MGVYIKGPVRIHYEEFGSGFPLMLIAGGGLNSTIAALNNPFDAIAEFKGEYRCIAADLPDDIPAHPYAIAMEAAMLAPNAEVSIFPWKEPTERIPLAIRQIRSLLRAHCPASK